jgi:hypothetical protein
VLHLLECRGCAQERTLPRRYRTEPVRAYLEATEQHGRCRRKLHVRESLNHPDGAFRFELYCATHTAAPWTKEVTDAETVPVVRAFVDAARTAEAADGAIHRATDA